MTDLEVHPDPDGPDDPDDRIEDGPAVVYPELDGKGGTVFRTGSAIGEEPREATYEDWARTNGVTPPTKSEVDEEDDGGTSPRRVVRP